MASHGYTWDQVRSKDTAEIQVGTTWIQPGVGTAYYEAADGSVTGHGWLRLDGTAWTATALEGNVVTAKAHDGRTLTDTIPQGRTVLIVTED